MLKSPEEWRAVANELKQLLDQGNDIGDSLRKLAQDGTLGAGVLCKAVESTCACSHREASQIVAHEVTARSL